MASNGEKTFKIHKIDDRTAYELILQIRGIIGVSDLVKIIPMRSFLFSDSEFGQENIRVGSYSIPEIRLSGNCPENGQHFTASFRRFVDGPDSSISPFFDEVHLHFQGEHHSWTSLIGMIISSIDAITNLDTPANSIDTGQSPDVLRQLIASNNATHHRMMTELNKAVSDMIDRRAELDEEAHNVAAKRAEEHEAAIKKLEEERQKLKLQSHMSERRSVSQKIDEMATSLSLKSFKSQRALSIGFVVFSVSMCHIPEGDMAVF